MSEWVRDTAFGQLIRLLSRRKYFQYLEERDPELWKKFVNEEKSGYAAHHGTTQPHADDSDTEEWTSGGIGGVRTRDGQRGSDFSGETQVEEGVNQASGRKIDPEKGRDIHIVDFLEHDPEVRSLPSSVLFQGF